jgi:hypothetical protein
MPGEKVIFYDDFTDMAGGDPPPHWKVRGTVPELKVGGGIRQLTVKGDHLILTPNLDGLPANFTMETDLVFEGNDPDCKPELEWHFLDKANGSTVMNIRTKQGNGNTWWLRIDVAEGPLV